ncbi:type III pantothenate kinase [uncultured Peptoniphilus sp.]|uniref:type III pantothenate kinase n=1 Tax=uncultured Peptoniphilus sp. TaxID=254354 RepID=UPI002805E975|nr:type III pantothenate kinase [uncultured Peptoniphilus sp.]
MLLAVNIENHYISFGIFEANNLIGSFKIKTDINRSADELSFLIKNLLMERNISLKNIDDLIVSNVVPEMLGIFEEISLYLFKKKIINVGRGTKSGLDIKCESPKEVGADRITRAVGALNIFKGPILVINMSSVTTIDYINEKNQFMGGLIFPGIDLAQEILKIESSKLPNVEISFSKKIIGNTTSLAMKSGLYYSYINSVKGIIKDIEKSLGHKDFHIVLTGEFAHLLRDMENYNIYCDKDLNFKGLKIIYDLNKTSAK